MILVPKLKYEHLLQKLGKNEEPVKPDTVIDDQIHAENTETDTTRSKSIDDTSQTGSGYVSKTKTIGKPPGVAMKRRRKHIPWLSYLLLN